MLSINQCYLDFVDKILKTGKETYKDSNHHLLESLGNFYIIDDPMDLKFRAKYQNYTTDMMLADIKSGKFDIEGSPIKSDALYQYVQSVEDPEIINNTQGFVYTYPKHEKKNPHRNRIKPCRCSYNQSYRGCRRRGHSLSSVPAMPCA